MTARTAVTKACLYFLGFFTSNVFPTGFHPPLISSKICGAPCTWFSPIITSFWCPSERQRFPAEDLKMIIQKIKAKNARKSLSAYPLMCHHVGIRPKSVLVYGWFAVSIRSKSVLVYDGPLWYTSTTLLLKLGIRSNSGLVYGRYTVVYGLGVLLVYGRYTEVYDGIRVEPW